MATRTWSSSGSGDLTASANWGGNTPVSGDSAIWPRGNEHGVTTNLSGFAFKLKEMRTRRGFTGNIGSNGSPIVTSAESIWLEGSGDVYFEDRGTTDTDFMLVDMESPDSFVNIGGDKTGIVVVKRGRVHIEGVVDKLDVSHHANPFGDSRVTVGSSATLGEVVQSSGDARCDTAVTAWDMSGGLAVQDVGKISTLNLTGGRMIVRATTLGDCHVGPDGILDLSQLTQPITIDTYVGPRSSLIAPHDSDLVVITNRYFLDSGSN